MSQRFGLPRKTASIWAVYRKEYEVDHGEGHLWTVSCTDRPRRLAFVEQKEKSVAQQKKILFTRLDGRSFVRCLEIFESRTHVHLVLKPTNMSLTHRRHHLVARGTPYSPRNSAAVKVEGSTDVVRSENHKFSTTRVSTSRTGVRGYSFVRYSLELACDCISYQLRYV